MTSRCILQIALLLCFSTSALSTSYGLFQLQHIDNNLECMKLLRQLSGAPAHCLENRTDFKLPEEITQPQQFQKEDAALLIHEMLQNIFDIFRRNFSNTGWNETIVNNLLDELHQQMDHLETVLEEKLEEGNLILGNAMPLLHLKSYYWRIVRYLKAKEFSHCAWTVVLVELLRNFSLIDRLMNDFKI